MWKKHKYRENNLLCMNTQDISYDVQNGNVQFISGKVPPYLIVGGAPKVGEMSYISWTHTSSCKYVQTCSTHWMASTSLHIIKQKLLLEKLLGDFRMRLLRLSNNTNYSRNRASITLGCPTHHCAENLILGVVLLFYN